MSLLAFCKVLNIIGTPNSGRFFRKTVIKKQKFRQSQKGEQTS
jgi:hypothetical protein